METRPMEIEGGNCPQCEQPVAVNSVTWWCPKCLIGARDFGFMTLKEAREYVLRRRQAESKTFPQGKGP